MGCFRIFLTCCEGRCCECGCCKCVFETVLSDLAGVSPETGLLNHSHSVINVLRYRCDVLSGCTVLPSKQPHGSSSSASSPTLVVPDSRHPGGCEVASHCGFPLCSLMTRMPSIFSCACWPLLYLWKCGHLSPVPNFESGWLFSFVVESLEVLKKYIPFVNSLLDT